MNKERITINPQMAQTATYFLRFGKAKTPLGKPHK
jgi:hypothetical protein